METQRVTLNISRAAYERLQTLRAARDLVSDEQVVEQALAERNEDTHNFDSQSQLDAWIRDVVIPADDYDRAHPETSRTLEEFEADFWKRHGVKRSA